MDLLKEGTTEVSFLSVTADTSNHQAVKLIPIVIRYFTLTEVVNVKIFNFSLLPGETSTLLFDEVPRGLCAFGLIQKWLGFC